MKKVTHEDFVGYVSEQVGDEYSVLSTYTKATQPIKMRHNKCCCPEGFYDYSTTPHSFKCGKRCPYESHQIPYGLDIFDERLKAKFPMFRRVGEEYVNAITPIDVECDKGHAFGISLNQLSGHSYKGCPYCSNHRVWRGFNDLWTTHPNIASMLKNPEDGYKYTYGTTTKLEFICPFCGEIIFNYPNLLINKNGQIKCKKCGDGFSYPEKLFTAVLDSLGIKYTYQLSSKHFNWCGTYFYDYYLEDYDCIVELHGRQHYTNTIWASFETISANDNAKKELALKHISNYIVIDCSESSIEFISKSILNSELANYISMDKIDWSKCGRTAIHSKMRTAISDYNSGIDPKQIATKLNVLNDTLYNYLLRGNELGLCNFDKREYLRSEKSKLGLHKGGKKVKCVETGEYFISLSEAARHNVYLNKQIINNPNRTSNGYHWITVD